MNEESMGSHLKFAPEFIRQRIHELGKWFHNIALEGVRTAPDHFLGDYPAVKWKRFAHAIPSDLRGKSVLDIGCNGGFYSIEMKLRGAHPLVQPL
jgi:tRNA (mo5U34)-methyltransferase